MDNYSLEDTQGLMRTFASWIGKKAHVGQGKTEILNAIEIEESTRIVRALAPDKKYSIHFKFESKRKFTAEEFLKLNGLEELGYHIPSKRQPQETA